LLLGGHPETILYALGLVLAFLLDKVRRRPAGSRRALLVRTGGAMAIAFMLAAPALLPAIDYAPKTMRAARLRPALPHRASETSPRGRFAPPARLARRWLPIAAPNAYGNSRFLYYWG